MKFSEIRLKVAGIGLMLLAISSAISLPRRASELRVGDELPKMNLVAKPNEGLSPSEEAKRFTLLHFWASYDAESRRRNLAYGRFFAKTLSDKVAYQAVSLDTSGEVHRLTLELDGLDGLHYLCEPNRREQIIANYKLGDGMHTYLVDSEGRVLSVDPSIEELEKYYLL